MNSDHTDHVEDVKVERSFAGLGIDVLLRSCGLNVRLVQSCWGEYLKEMEESLLMIKTTENRTEMKQFKSFRFQEYENTRGKLSQA